MFHNNLVKLVEIIIILKLLGKNDENKCRYYNNYQKQVRIKEYLPRYSHLLLGEFSSPKSPFGGCTPPNPGFSPPHPEPHSFSEKRMGKKLAEGCRPTGTCLFDCAPQ